MGLKPCPICDKNISETAVKCVHCGEDYPFQPGCLSRLFFWTPLICISAWLIFDFGISFIIMFFSGEWGVPFILTRMVLKNWIAASI